MQSAWRQSILVEAQPGVELHLLTWEQVAAPNDATWRTALSSWDITAVEQDGEALTQAASLADCFSTAQTWFQDFFSGWLFLHLTAGDNPGGLEYGENKYFLVGRLFKCFSQAVNPDDLSPAAVAFTPTGAARVHSYEPFLPVDYGADITQSIADLYTGTIELSSGELTLLNIDGWAYQSRTLLLWENASVRILAGEAGAAYADHEVVFAGKLSSPRYNDERMVLGLQDSRQSNLGSLPVNYFRVDDFPNLADDAVNKAIPLVFGQRAGIIPACIDTTAYIYKACDTTFGGTTYGIEAVDAVYLDGAALILGVDYTVDLDEAEITLLADPGDALVSCDIKGLNCEMDFTGAGPTGGYSANAADIVGFILEVIKGVPAAEIDYASFAILKVIRTQNISYYLGSATAAIEAVRVLQQSAMFYTIPTAAGLWSVRYYAKAISADVQILRHYEVAELELTSAPENVFDGVLIRYDRNPIDGTYKVLRSENTAARWKYRLTRPVKEIEVALASEAEAEVVLGYYSALFAGPASKVSFSGNAELLALQPLDKIRLDYLIRDDRGRQVQVTAADLEHSDSGHADSSHIDTAAHTDYTDHTDGYTDSHSDGAHSDTAHSDSHSDTSHVDSHADASGLHTDVVHIDSHSDGAHVDSYSDTPYIDHLDGPTHTDEAHVDSHSDGAHVDSYSDTAHADSGHLDAHGDHTDGAEYEDGYVDGDHSDGYTDQAHADSHSDVLHADSAHSDSHSDTSHYTDDYSDTPYLDQAHVDTAHGDSVTDEVFIVLSVEKQFMAGAVRVTAQDEGELAIFTAHADQVHLDTHSDHTDTIHSDLSHNDAHSDSHSDDAHADVEHSDSHSDVAYGDGPPYLDTAHGDVHVDNYNDHTDGPHLDSYNDHHTDVAHGDTAHADNLHIDEHGDSGHADSPHGDTAHIDTHSDRAHGDYSDLQHTDQHSDLPHIDSEV